MTPWLTVRPLQDSPFISSVCLGEAVAVTYWKDNKG
jgi:hypothetical protein